MNFREWLSHTPPPEHIQSLINPIAGEIGKGISAGFNNALEKHGSPTDTAITGNRFGSLEKEKDEFYLRLSPDDKFKLDELEVNKPVDMGRYFLMKVQVAGGAKAQQRAVSMALNNLTVQQAIHGGHLDPAKIKPIKLTPGVDTFGPIITYGVKMGKAA